MVKLTGLDYSIQYRRGKENVVVDALSRCQEEGSTSAITVVVPEWCQEVIDSYANDEQVKKTLEEVMVIPNWANGYTLTEGMLVQREDCN